MKKISVLPILVFGCLFVLASDGWGQTPLVNIETVSVGDIGNTPDSQVMDDSTTGYGAVAYEFNIAKYEVTIGQYAIFLNSVASLATESYIVDLWNADMASDARIAGISRSGSGNIVDPYIYSVIGPLGLAPIGANSASNRPITYVSWFDAARFANWVNNGSTNGSSTETGAYTLNGATNGAIGKNEGATWWLPSENEWYKAAYYKSGGTNAGYWLYPTQSDTAPGNNIGNETNQANRWDFDFAVTQAAAYEPNQNYLTDIGAFSESGSAYDTFDQGGNVYEFAGAPNLIRGGGYNQFGENDLRATWRGFYPSDVEGFNIGFRVATIPEPSTYALLLLGGASLWALKRRKR